MSPTAMKSFGHIQTTMRDFHPNATPALSYNDVHITTARVNASAD